MTQLNINVTPEFEKNLKEYMKRKGLTEKSEAVRRAVEEAVKKSTVEKKETDFDKWLGMGLKAPLEPNPRFTNEDDLWEKKG